MHQEPNQDLSSNDNTTLPPNAVESLQDEFDTIHLGNPSSRVNGRPGKRYPALGPRRVGKWQAKGKPRLQECGDGGEW